MSNNTQKYNSYKGQILSTHPEYVWACRQADKLQLKEKMKSKYQSVSKFIWTGINLVRKRPVIFLAIFVTIIVAS